jgi:hypothetical protein
MKFTEQLATAAAVLVAGMVLSACGGGSGSSDQAYCDKVKDSRVD